MQSWPQRFAGFVVLSVGLGTGAFGCAPPQATRPPATPGTGSVARRDLYDKYKLKYHSGFLHDEWTRSDGEFTFEQLTNVLDAYPESRETKTMFQAGEAIGAGMAVTSGALVGYALVDDGLASSTRRALYIAGGSVFAGALVVQLLWPAHPRDVADAYNRALSRDLTEASAGLDPPVLRPRRAPWTFAAGAIPVPLGGTGPIRGLVGAAVWAF
jgi:hypothetical protein